MAYTGEQVRDHAAAHSVLNDSSIVDDGETVRQINQVVLELVGSAPWMFATRTTIAAPGGSGPYDLSSLGTTDIFRVEKVDGTKVTVTPFGQQDTAYKPRLYRIRDKLYTPDNAPDPDPDDTQIVVFHAEEPDLLSVIGDTVWASFEDRWMRLVILEVAKFYALKRKATTEAELLGDDLDRVQARFDAEAERWREMFDEPTWPVPA